MYKLFLKKLRNKNDINENAITTNNVTIKEFV